ncbi:hypothetical protein JKL49_11495 [Phenylobacterium sp. 20VBR1]|uniref:DUF4170 domain-containing protein n=1 Tax=Phenylobacterium glaciei TaxID=2803784 RepID=A0A941HX70_9CAUL|nr:hypothetical protein [Phenylobacterium glaciei]MBR7620012.1 hypothetical protein [Phenylobacterium glaciei]
MPQVEASPDRYWVIGGKHLDATLQRRQWSEVFGPFCARAEAEAMQRRMDDIYAADPQVRFCVVRDADHGS